MDYSNEVAVDEKQARNAGKMKEHSVERMGGWAAGRGGVRL